MSDDEGGPVVAIDPSLSGDNFSRQKSKTFAARAADLKNKLRGALHHPDSGTYEPKLISEGWLQKKSPAGVRGFKRWQERWCKLDSVSFSYYRNATCDQHLGSIPVAHIKSVEAQEMKKGSCRFDILTKHDRVYAFLAHTREDCYNWVYSLHYQLDHQNIGQSMYNVQILGAQLKAPVDATCTLELWNREGKCVSRRQTTIVGASAQPVWNANFDLHLDEELVKSEEYWSESRLRVIVLDQATLEQIGEVQLEAFNVGEGNTKPNSHTIVHKEHGEVGTIELILHYETSKYAAIRQGHQFGVNLTQLPLHHLPQYERGIPTLLIQMKDYLVQHGLDTEGIFRVAPAEDEVNTVKDLLNHGSFTSCSDVHCVAHLIKVFLRDLPVRLLANIDPDHIENVKSRDEAFGLVSSVPEPERSILFWLLDLCVLVTANEGLNKMSAKNMGIVLGPNLLPPLKDPQRELQLSKKLNEVVENAIVYRREHPAVVSAARRIPPPRPPPRPRPPARPTQSGASHHAQSTSESLLALASSPQSKTEESSDQTGAWEYPGAPPPPPPPAPFLGDILEPNRDDGMMSGEYDDDVIDEEVAFSDVVRGINSEAKQRLKPTTQINVEDSSVVLAKVQAAISGQARRKLKHVQLPEEGLSPVIKQVFLQERRSLKTDKQGFLLPPGPLDDGGGAGRGVGGAGGGVEEFDRDEVSQTVSEFSQFKDDVSQLKAERGDEPSQIREEPSQLEDV